jgi:hypothetical protein
MPPAKGGNSKKEAGRAKKEENEVSSVAITTLTSFTHTQELKH